MNRPAKSIAGGQSDGSFGQIVTTATRWQHRTIPSGCAMGGIHEHRPASTGVEVPEAEFYTATDLPDDATVPNSGKPVG
jgi:hypothetical protein